MRSEPVSDNCRTYPSRTNYIHCNGTQLRLTDSEIGPLLQYDPSYYYEWTAESVSRQLLFIFPTRVNLTTITLHYYSNSTSQRGLPRLSFHAVSDNFNVWDGTRGDWFVVVAAVQPAVELDGRRNILVDFNFNTKKVLMVKAPSAYKLAVSEVTFYTSQTCNGNSSLY